MQASKSRLLLFLYAGSAVLFIIFAGVLTTGAAVGPRTCLICHAQAEAIASWGRSSHANVACAACHVNRGFQDFSKLGVGHFLQTASDSSNTGALELGQGILPPVSGDMCRRCHSPELRRFTVRRGLNMNHEKHLENDLACVICHNLVAHPLKGPVDPAIPGDGERRDGLNMIQGCWRCHSPEPAFWDENLRASLPASASPPTECKTCHKSAWEMKPTTGSINHLDDNGVPWASGTLRHGKAARELGFVTCFGCHDRQEWCAEECHGGVAMPHNIPAYGGKFAAEGEGPWRETHFVVAQETYRAPCAMCHDSKWNEERDSDYCMACHHKSFYERYPEIGKPWVKAAMPFVDEHGASECWTCHQPEFCSTCHSTGKKPPPGTTFARD